MTNRLGTAALWATAGFLLGAAALAGGQAVEDLREKLIELERLSAQLRSLEAENATVPVDERGFELDRIHVTDLVTGMPDFGRARRDAEGAAIFGYEAEEAPQAYGTMEEIQELVRVSVRPDAWESGAQIACLGSSLLLHAPPDLNRAVREFLDRDLRPGVRRTVNLQLEILEAEEPLAGALAAATGGEIDPGLRARVEEAIGAGQARRAFDGRVLALSRQQVVFWHGAQVAMVPDADVEVATRSECVDPLVDVELLGTMVEARSTVGEDPSRIRVRISLERNELAGPVRAAETEQAGTFQMPARTTMGIDADLWTGNDRWAVAAERTDGEKRRFLLVRPSLVGGGR